MTLAVRYLGLSVLLFTYLCGGMWAQSTTSVRGYVTDPSGAAIPDAKVQITLIGTNASRDTATDKDGFYQFLQLAPGAYKLSVSATGFSTVEQSNLNLIVNLPASLDFHLTIAGSTESIEVTNALPMMNTVDATLGNSFN